MKKKIESNKRTRARQKYCPNCGLNIRGTHNFISKNANLGKLVFTCIGVNDR